MKYNMIRTAAFLLLSLSFLKVTAQKNKEKVKLPEISKEIIKMRDEEQKMRIKWAGFAKKGKTETEKFKELTKTLIASDRANTARMREIVVAHGWPTYELVGKGASNSAWLLVQHADRNPLFQAKCLPLLKEAVDAGQANPTNYAYLYDRVQISVGEMQHYATQSTSNNGITEGYFQTIWQEHNVQNRREEMGIKQNIVDYAKSMGFKYTILTKEEAFQNATDMKLRYKSLVEKAAKAMQGKDYSNAASHYLEITELYGSVQTEDYVAAARAISLADHKAASWASAFLTKAMARGWDGLEVVKNDPDFERLRTTNPNNWADFMITAEEMKLDQ